MAESLVEPLCLGQVPRESLKVLIRHKRLTGILLRHDLDIAGLLPSERDLVAYDFIFYRILQWRIQNNTHLFAPDEAHLNEPLPETSVAPDAHNHASLSRLKLRKPHLKNLCGCKGTDLHRNRQSPFVVILKRKLIFGLLFFSLLLYRARKILTFAKESI